MYQLTKPQGLNKYWAQIKVILAYPIKFKPSTP